MTCQGAWDNDEVSSSIWHPGGSGAGASTTIYTGEEVIIHRVTVRQFRVSRLNTFHMLCADNSELLALDASWVQRHCYRLGRLTIFPPSGGKEVKIPKYLNA